MRLSSKLESLLNMTLPESYKNFIDKTGYLNLSNIGIEIYGYKPGFNVEKIPCVIAATKLNQQDYHLDKDQIVISHTGFEDYITVLDIVSDFVFEINLMGDKKFLADSFSDWLASKITENNLTGSL